MATKAKPKSNRGGARPGAGRKPKAIRELQEQVIAGRLPEPDAATKHVELRTSADFALTLFDQIMRDAQKPLELRLDCAREVLNRTIGKPRLAEPTRPAGEEDEQVHIYMPDNGRDTCVGAG